MRQAVLFVKEFACACESRVVHLLKNLCAPTSVVYPFENLFFRIRRLRSHLTSKGHHGYLYEVVNNN